MERYNKMDARTTVKHQLKTNFSKSTSSSCLNNYKKLKRYRSAFTTEQIRYLETEFKKFPYIGVQNRKEIAAKLKMQERAIKIWFQNRRMKEKKDVVNKELHHYEQMSLNGINLVNDQLNNIQQSNNDVCQNSTTLQTKPKTNLNKLSIDKILNKKDKESSNNSTTETIKNYPNRDDVIRSPYFQSNTVTSSSNDYNSTENMKQYRDQVNSVDSKNVPKNCIVKRRPENSKCTGKPKTVRQEVCQSKSNGMSTVTHQQPKFIQVASGYVPVYPDNYYQHTFYNEGNVLWKSLNSADMTAIIPFKDFVVRQPAEPYRLPQNINMQMNKCLCNCHMNHVTNPIALPQQNHITQAQYVIAIPCHSSPNQFPPPT